MWTIKHLGPTQLRIFETHDHNYSAKLVGGGIPCIEKTIESCIEKEYNSINKGAF